MEDGTDAEAGQGVRIAAGVSLKKPSATDAGAQRDPNGRDPNRRGDRVGGRILHCLTYEMVPRSARMRFAGARKTEQVEGTTVV